MKRFVSAILTPLLAPLPLPAHPTLAREGLHLGWRLGWLKGWALRPWWKFRTVLGGPRLVIGHRFSLQGTLRCSGPGTIMIGDDVIVAGTTTPFTHAPRAMIRIGSRCFLNGTRFGCARSIEVGDESILADSRIMDTDFHAIHKNRNSPNALPKVSPVRIGRNAWLGAASAILKGVEIGDNSVVAFGSVVVGDVASGRIVAGNPARDITEVPDS